MSNKREYVRVIDRITVDINSIGSNNKHNIYTHTHAVHLIIINLMKHNTLAVQFIKKGRNIHILKKKIEKYS